MIYIMHNSPKWLAIPQKMTFEEQINIHRPRAPHPSPLQVKNQYKLKSTRLMPTDEEREAVGLTEEEAKEVHIHVHI